VSHPDSHTLLAYSLGTLRDEDLRAVHEHLPSCPDCRGEVGRDLETLAAITLSQPQVPVPAEWEDDLIARARAATGNPLPAVRPVPSRAAPGRSRRPAPRRSWASLAAVAVAAAALVLAVPPLASFLRESRDNAYVVSLLQDPSSGRPFVNPQSGEAAGVVGTLPSGRLVVVLDRPPPEGRVYQAWRIVGDQRDSVGLSEGRVIALTASVPPGGLVGVTTEPPGGSPGPTTTPIGRVEL